MYVYVVLGVDEFSNFEVLNVCVNENDAECCRVIHLMFKDKWDAVYVIKKEVQ